jgi:hypothetical protein
VGREHLVDTRLIVAQPDEVRRARETEEGGHFPIFSWYFAAMSCSHKK